MYHPKLEWVNVYCSRSECERALVEALFRHDVTLHEFVSKGDLYHLVSTYDLKTLEKYASYYAEANYKVIDSTPDTHKHDSHWGFIPFISKFRVGGVK